MELKNKKTGEIGKPTFISVDYEIAVLPDGKSKTVYYYSSLAGLNEEWEDYKEPEEDWFIDYDGGIIPFNVRKETATDRLMKSIGNYFETKEEAERALEKLKAWKRLKDKGFRFKTYMRNPTGTYDCFAIWEDSIPPSSSDIAKDLALLFGGEE